MAKRHLILIFIALSSLVALFFIHPIRQDLAYHSFADQREWLGIPHFWNVISNLPFLIIGLYGIVTTNKPNAGTMRSAWLVFFIGVSLVSFGSAYYHWNPNNQTLVWDRLPMTVGFMGLFAALIGEYINPRVGVALLVPLLVLGFISVLVWHATDDLRLYAWVQFMPLLCIPFILLLNRPQHSHQRWIYFGLFFYVGAKLFEHFDDEIMSGLNSHVSGHAIKHVFAALGGLCIAHMLKKRHPAKSPLSDRGLAMQN
jgi:hypothetical protein